MRIMNIQYLMTKLYLVTVVSQLLKRASVHWELQKAVQFLSTFESLSTGIAKCVQTVPNSFGLVRKPSSNFKSYLSNLRNGPLSQPFSQFNGFVLLSLCAFYKESIGPFQFLAFFYLFPA